MDSKTKLSLGALAAALIAGGAFWWSLSGSPEARSPRNAGVQVDPPQTNQRAEVAKRVSGSRFPASVQPRQDTDRPDEDLPEQATDSETRPESGDDVTRVEVFTNLETLNFALKAPKHASAQPEPEYHEIAVKLSGPDNYRTESVYPVAGGKEATLSIVHEDGKVLPDGLYKYEAYAQGELVSGDVPADGAEYEGARVEMDQSGRHLSPEVRKELAMRPKQTVVSGTFRIHEGQIVQPIEEASFDEEKKR